MAKEPRSCFATCPVGLLCATGKACLARCYFCVKKTKIISEDTAQNILEFRTVNTGDFTDIRKRKYILELDHWDFWKLNPTQGFEINEVHWLKRRSCSVLKGKEARSDKLDRVDVCRDCARKIEKAFGLKNNFPTDKQQAVLLTVEQIGFILSVEVEPVHLSP